ncbi:GHKL domain-containing protein [Maribellus comscasis]|uniref:GHKL domain-containing protein n=1 Tax=Maribellus comscasis TaxID=2681766 RepID=A0A6I6JNX1_9BACT|nr:histidine kinase [Maribellus comscasis]QGY42680.1 GHKL domain-containing protein [Maribellus comscasis]
MNKSTARKKGLPVLLHILAWFVLLILPQIIISRYWGNNNFIPWDFYLSAAVYGFIFYFNYLLLVPRFYLKEKKTIYFAVALAVIIVSYFVFIYINRLTHNPERDKVFEEAIRNLAHEREIRRPPFRLIQMYQYSILSIIITGFSIGLRVIEKHSASEKRQKELEKEKLHSELAFLKNQVSPHFFFNTLNNIYSLIEVNTNDAQEAVMKLSRMMRYLLYESESEKTQLSNEINFLNHYIDLMRLRLSRKVDLLVDLPANDSKLKVPPLLFIPFIENAFKHGITYREKSFIHISMKIEDCKILFSCKNSIGKQLDKEINENHSGIGLENVKKRLNLIFPDKYILNIEPTEKEFDVSLEIDLKDC